ncbi:MAG: AAA family ATPase [Nitrosomonas sp.]|nr:AAA family ATPase [Nitrosomonas sp.]
MADIAKKLQAKYSEKNRYSNFGPCLRKIHIDGFRGIYNIDFELDFPITVVSGLNGAGKSTIGQLAICAYKKPSTSVDYKRQYIKDFFLFHWLIQSQYQTKQRSFISMRLMIIRSLKN